MFNTASSLSLFVYKICPKLRIEPCFNEKNDMIDNGLGLKKTRLNYSGSINDGRVRRTTSHKRGICGKSNLVYGTEQVQCGGFGAVVSEPEKPTKC